MKKYNFNMMVSLLILAIIHLTASSSQFSIMGVDGLSFFISLIHSDSVLIYFIALIIFLSSLVTAIYKTLSGSDN